MIGEGVLHLGTGCLIWGGVNNLGGMDTFLWIGLRFKKRQRKI